MSRLHPRNIHRKAYDFAALCSIAPELEPHVVTGPHQQKTIDFADPEAVKLLNKALLAYHYDIKFWDIPEGYLCPAIPGRADYIHYLADLLGEGQKEGIPRGNKTRILDIGTGANCVYPILGNRIYGWSFVATETDQKAVNTATAIVKFNKVITNHIDVRLQKNKLSIFKNVVLPNERFTASMCNPPFYTTAADALAANRRKIRGLSGKKSVRTKLNFGGQQTELVFPGGEVAFIENMIRESAQFKSLCNWFTTLVSQEKHLRKLNDTLKKVTVKEIRIINMAQGQKQSRILAWRF